MQTITISNLKTHLSAEIKKLKKNGGIEIVQRDVPVARLMPVEERGTLRFYSKAKAPFRFLKPVIEVDFDPVELLLEDRRKERI
jgi:antitoxin (DNA-binding transcriptional repressor) of toxin-antitoxin stability system